MNAKMIEENYGIKNFAFPLELTKELIDKLINIDDKPSSLYDLLYN